MIVRHGEIPSGLFVKLQSHVYVFPYIAQKYTMQLTKLIICLSSGFDFVHSDVDV